MDKILHELSANYNISGKELSIIQAINVRKNTAHGISKETKIPVGRIYEYLNSLIEKKLIERTEKKPYQYYIENLHEQVQIFLKNIFEDTVKKQRHLLQTIEESSSVKEGITTIDSGNEFSIRYLQIIKEAKYIKTMNRHGTIPFICYPKKMREFLAIRKYLIEKNPSLAYATPEITYMIQEAYFSAINEGKNIEFVVEKKSLKEYHTKILKKFGKKYWKKIVQQIQELENVHIYVFDEFIPMQTIISEEQVLLSLIHHRHTKGIVIKGKSAHDIYDEYIEEIKDRCILFDENMF